MMASTKPGAWILDPFAGSSTTGIAANLLGRRFLGIEKEEEFAAMSKARSIELNKIETYGTFRRKIPDIVKAEDTQTDCFACQEPLPIEELPFFDEIIKNDKHQKTDSVVWVFNWLLMKSLQSHVSTSLPPVVYDDSEALILGAKLLKNEKYETANSNRFWQNISKKYNGGWKFFDKVDKISCLKRHHLALWDVFNPDGTKNDVDAFLKSNPQIKEVMFYGKNVMRFYKPKLTNLFYREFQQD